MLLNAFCIHLLLWPLARKLRPVYKMICARGKDRFTACPCALQFAAILIEMGTILAVNLSISKVSLKEVAVLKVVRAFVVWLGVFQRS